MVGVRPTGGEGRERERETERLVGQSRENGERLLTPESERERDVRVLRERLVGQSRENGERGDVVGKRKRQRCSQRRVRLPSALLALSLAN